MGKPRIVIADDHEIIRIGLKSILTRTGLYEVCGEAGDGHEVLRKTRNLQPDLLVLDYELPLQNGIDVARQLMHEVPRTSILMFPEFESERVALDALSFGVKGIVLKSEGVSALLSGIDTVLHGKTCFTPRIGQMLLNFAKQYGSGEILTAREKEIVQLLAEACSTKEIAHKLALTVKTAETHRSKILRKLQLHSTAEVILYAVRNQIVHIGPTPEELTACQLSRVESSATESCRRAVAA